MEAQSQAFVFSNKKCLNEVKFIGENLIGWMERVKFSSRLPSNRMEPDRNGSWLIEDLEFCTTTYLQTSNGEPSVMVCPDVSLCRTSGIASLLGALPVSSDPDCDCLLSPNF